MKFTGIHHCAVMVADMDRAVSFYREVLGLREIVTPETFANAGMRVRWFDLDGQHIHLLPAAQSEAISQRHVALHVDDAVKAREELRGKGVEVRESVPIPGADRFFIRDPDGNRIELIQWKEQWRAVPVEA